MHWRGDSAVRVCSHTHAVYCSHCNAGAAAARLRALLSSHPSGEIHIPFTWKRLKIPPNKVIWCLFRFGRDGKGLLSFIHNFVYNDFVGSVGELFGFVISLTHSLPSHIFVTCVTFVIMFIFGTYDHVHMYIYKLPWCCKDHDIQVQQ